MAAYSKQLEVAEVAYAAIDEVIISFPIQFFAVYVVVGFQFWQGRYSDKILNFCEHLQHMHVMCVLFICSLQLLHFCCHCCFLVLICAMHLYYIYES